MTLALEKQAVPLITDHDGVVRIAGSRITLDVVIEAFHEGATPEEMAQQYPSLGLGELYAVIGYYLQQRAEIDEYLQARAEQGRIVRREVEARLEPSGIRERLLSRRGT